MPPPVVREFPLPPRAAERVGPDGRPLFEVPPARDAATVMLLRDAPAGRDGIEVFTFRRVPRMVFAPGMLVFPGGSVDPADADPTPVLAAAVRETFEECGVLLARDPSGRAPDAAALASPAWEERREALASGRVPLGDVLADAGLAVDAAALLPWAHWITPEFERRRFDTRFFVARLPEGQEARDLGGEGERAAWLGAGEAVTRHAAGELPMLPPTLVCLEELARARSVEHVLGTARCPRPVSPWIARHADGSLVLRAEIEEWTP